MTFAPAVASRWKRYRHPYREERRTAPGNAGGSSTFSGWARRARRAPATGLRDRARDPGRRRGRLPKLVTVPPGTLPGRYFVLAAADATALIVETNDDLADNLGASATRLVVGPDVVPTAATVPAAIATGGNLSVTYTLKNQGGAPAGPFNVSFVLVPTGAAPGSP